jgi:hypothetical protein
LIVDDHVDSAETLQLVPKGLWGGAGRGFGARSASFTIETPALDIQIKTSLEL